MAGKNEVTGSVEGVEETQAAFLALAARAGNDQEAAAKAAAVVAAAAGPLAPRLTGALAASYGVEDRFVVNPLPYAGFVEYGANGVAPSYVVGRAWDTQAATIEAVYAEWLAGQARAEGFEATSG